MISRAQGKLLSGEAAVNRLPKLTVVEKAMLKWMVVDPQDRLLDTCVGNGMMAEYLRRNMQCEVCGVSDNMESVRIARSRLRSCDIVYAVKGDIPWKENAFDAVLMKYGGEEDAVFHRMLCEAARVLRPGGQLILGALCYPAALQAVVSLFASEDSEEKLPFRRETVTDMLSGCEFENITWQRTGISTGVTIAWKRKQDVHDLRNDT